MEDRTERLVLRVSDDALNRWLTQLRAGSRFESPQRYELNAYGFSHVVASLELRRLRLGLHETDAGALRFEVAARSEYRFGVAYPKQRVDLYCAVLTRPTVTRSERDGLRLETDLGTATIEGLRVDQSSHGGLLAFDPGLFDPFAEDRLRELARITLHLALRRQGRLERTLEHRALRALLATLPESEKLRISIGEGELRIAASGEGDGVRATATHAVGRPVADTSLRVSESTLGRLVRDLLDAPTPLPGGDVESPRVHVRADDERIELEASLRPRLRHWPKTWWPRLRFGFAPELDQGGIGLRIVDVDWCNVALPGWIRRRLGEYAGRRIGPLTWPRNLGSPRSESPGGHGRLEVAGLELQDRAVEIHLETALQGTRLRARPRA